MSFFGFRERLVEEVFVLGPFCPKAYGRAKLQSRDHFQTTSLDAPGTYLPFPVDALGP